MLQQRVCHADESADEEVCNGQEEVAVFMEESSFMQGVVGLNLMPSDLSSTDPRSVQACVVNAML